MNRDFTVEGPIVTADAKGLWQSYPRGRMIIRDGYIIEMGDVSQVRGSTKEIRKYSESELIIPGLIDLHTHFAQSRAVSIFGGTLLSWLKTSIFPEELRIIDLANHSVELEFHFKEFINELVSQGTTCAMVFGVSNWAVTRAFLEFASKLKMKIISGPCLMDRYAPKKLFTDDMDRADDLLTECVEKFHKKGNVFVSICPRYAPSCSSSLLEQCGAWLEKFPSIFLQTHISENVEEVKWVKKLFPKKKSYAQVYDGFGLLGPKSFFAHGVHLSAKEFELLKSRKSSLVACPSANRFLGSGSFAWETKGSSVSGLGTDIGAGTSFSILKNCGEAYRDGLQRGQVLKVEQLMSLATTIPAKALDFPELGRLGPGTRADFVVLSPKRLPNGYWKDMWESKSTWQERLFLSMTAECRVPVLETWTSGHMMFGLNN